MPMYRRTKKKRRATSANSKYIWKVKFTQSKRTIQKSHIIHGCWAWMKWKNRGSEWRGRCCCWTQDEWCLLQAAFQCVSEELPELQEARFYTDWEGRVTSSTKANTSSGIKSGELTWVWHREKLLQMSYSSWLSQCERWVPLVGSIETGYRSALQSGVSALVRFVVCLVTLWGALWWRVVSGTAMAVAQCAISWQITS